MKPLLVTILLCLSSLVAHAADIASVNFDAIKDDLRGYYFAKPENAELKKEFEASATAERKQMEEMQKKMMENRKSIDLSTIIPAKGAVSRYELERKINADLKKELYVLISGLGLKYDLIYDSSDSAAIIYSKAQIDDVTPAVKQALIDLQKEK